MPFRCWNGLTAGRTDILAWSVQICQPRTATKLDGLLHHSSGQLTAALLPSVLTQCLSGLCRVHASSITLPRQADGLGNWWPDLHPDRAGTYSIKASLHKPCLPPESLHGACRTGNGTSSILKDLGIPAVPRAEILHPHGVFCFFLVLVSMEASLLTPAFSAQLR